MDEPLRPALAELAEGLDEGRRIFDESQEVNAGSVGAKAQLAAVLQFLRSLPEVVEDPAVIRPLVMLAQALISLDRGVVEPILQRSAVKGQPSPIADELLWSFAAAAAELFRRSGRSLKEAGKDVATRLTALGYDVTADRVLAWRRRAREGAHDAPLRQRYQRLIQPDNTTDPQLAAEQLLAQLALWSPKK